MRINNNISAMNTYSRLTSAQGAQAKSLEKLSSGLRINRAGDDAAGLAISEKMRGQIGGLNQAVRNAQDGISLIQTAEGALNETHSILNRMRELAVQSANDTNTDTDRTEINKEIEQLKTEVDRIANNTEFNTKKLLNGTLGGTIDTDPANSTVLDAAKNVAGVTTLGTKAGTYAITASTGKLTMSFGGKTQTIDNASGAQKLNFDEFGITIETETDYAADAAIGNVIVKAGTGATLQIGANKSQEMSLSIESMTATDLGINTIDLTTQTGASDAIESISNAIDTVSAERAKLGAYQNRLDHTINNLTTTSENLSAAESRIRDVDMAKEMMEFTKNNILNQASTAMLAQANQMPQGVLQLLG